MFAGILSYNHARPAPQWVDPDIWLETLYPRYQPDLKGHFQTTRILLVSGDIYNTQSSHNLTKTPMVDDNISIAFWGRLDNRAELAQQLGRTATLSETTDYEFILRGWRKWSEDLPTYLCGDFAFAIIDSHEEMVFLARDRAGIKPLYYWPHSDGFLFANSAAAFRCLDHVKPKPDSDWMIRYILGISPNHHTTAFEDILKLPAGHSLTSSHGNIRLKQYHQWRNDAPEIWKRDPAHLDGYKNLLENIIKVQMESAYPLGVETSGGIDSSTILANIARNMGTPGDQLHALGISILEDEPKYIMETSQAYDVRHNYLLTGNIKEGELDSDRIRESLSVLGYPCEHWNATSHTPFYAYCEKHGIRTLFSGFGGDEVVTNYAHSVVNELWQEKQYAAALSVMPRNPRSFIRRLLEQLIPQFFEEDFRQSNIYKNRNLTAQTLLNEDIVSLSKIDEEIAKYNAKAANHTTHNEWILDGLLELPAFASRLENCTLMAASYGAEYRWPLWNNALIQYYLSTPIIERLGPAGRTRYLHRRAIDGIVPNKVAWKKTKNMGALVNINPIDRTFIIDEINALCRDLPDQLANITPERALRGIVQRLENEPNDELLNKRAYKWLRSLKQLTLWLE